VIVAITDEKDRLLLAHNRSWKPRFMSLIAGFVEAGEAPEHAVVREAKEEASLDVKEVRYVATQPWPFPRSVMIGFTGKVSGTPAPSPDMEEVDAMKWMTRAELIDAVNSGELEIPTHTAIARMMIDTWLHAEGDAL
jgi:hydrolase, NUDIX family